MDNQMRPQHVQDFLRPILFGLPEDDLEALARAAIQRNFPAGAMICQEGKPGEAIYFIVSGRAEVVKEFDETHERKLRELESGDYFGEMAVLEQGPRTASVRTLEPTTVLEIDQEVFLSILGRSPALSVRILVHMTTRLRDSDRQSITELRQTNEELNRALERLKRLDQTKTDFIMVAAHELRTPVAALTGYAQMIQGIEGARSDRQLDTLVDGIVTSTDRLHRIFNSILDLSRVMSKEGLDVSYSPISITVIFSGIRNEFERALERRDLTLTLKGIEQLPFYSGDPDLLYKLFFHLVSNAIKYTPNGGEITVTGQKTVSEEIGLCLEVAVEDTGVGIATDDLDLIFEKFYRSGEVALHSSGETTFKGGGPGLGLAIARGIVVAHGGRIWAESPGYDEEGCPGSRFVVQLPLLDPQYHL